MNRKRLFGEYLTPIQIFERFIFPEIKNILYQYVWIDLFAGEGNLILPILKIIPKNERIKFFEKHIFLFDVQEKFIKQARKKAIKYGIPKEIAEKNIIQKDTIKSYPEFLLKLNLPIFHITNPPYLYIGNIKKNENLKEYLKYFEEENKGFQDLYQLALMNDLRNNIKKMIYIIPTNFLFGFSVSNKIRKEFFKYYIIKKALIFERKIFKDTGTNVCICFFERKEKPEHKKFSFEGIKFNEKIQKKIYILEPENFYRAGNDFEKFIKKFKSKKPLEVKYYLTLEEIKENKGNFELEAIDVNNFYKKEYKKIKIYVNEKIYNKIKSNILFLRTLDTGKLNGRAGIYEIKNIFGADAILVNKKHRTHPIHIFLEPSLSFEEQILLKNYFNLMLEYFRDITDSEFLTTFKYSNNEYTRKYLGLSQAKKLIQTFPLLILSKEEKMYFKGLVNDKNIKKIISFLKNTLNS